jgi:hypothetical protein
LSLGGVRAAISLKLRLCGSRNAKLPGWETSGLRAKKGRGATAAAESECCASGLRCFGSLGLLGLLLSPFQKGEATLTFDDLV